MDFLAGLEVFLVLTIYTRQWQEDMAATGSWQDLREKTALFR